ncbi:hypothetical protein BDN72DRAFT_897955 [Pluteus cervinus]|uniref:Uncharacterized protein n=1 Tax=Pluteus cervinus TaxID=181527 RepID=A0ACD3AUI0_9AGAR|nr:hypothetical protein BDN72DRAFT_897955 [Pluteus cervinus]
MNTEYRQNTPSDVEDVGELHEVQDAGAGPTSVENQSEFPAGDDGDQGQIAVASTHTVVRTHSAVAPTRNVVIVVITFVFNSLLLAIAVMLRGLGINTRQNISTTQGRRTNRPVVPVDGYEADDEDEADDADGADDEDIF